MIENAAQEEAEAVEMVETHWVLTRAWFTALSPAAADSQDCKRSKVVH